MLGKIARITGTSIDLEKLRPLAEQCVHLEHKDAWHHTVNVMTAKMTEIKKPTKPNCFAATVLKNALLSPARPAATPVQTAEVTPETAQAAPRQNPCQEYYENLDEAQKEALDKQALQETNPDWRKTKSCVKSNRNRIIAARMAGA